MSDYLNVVVSIKGRQLGRFSFTQPEITVGRQTGADIVLDNPGVSRQHACITSSAEGVAVADLQSNNGTFVNGASIQSSELRPGDELRVGKFSLDVVQSSEPFPAHTLSGSEALNAASVSSVHAGSAPGTDGGGPDLDGPDQTVIVSPQERQRLLKEKAAEPIIETHQEPPSNGMGRLLIGIAIGVFLAWLLL